MNDEKQNNEPTIGARLRGFIAEIGMNQTQFAESIGIPFDRLSTYVRDKNEPGAAFWSALAAKYAQANIAYLILGEYRESNSKEPSFYVPIVHRIRAGDMVQGFRDEEIIDQVAVSKKESNKIKFGLLVRGDSMEPEILDNDVVLFAPEQPFQSGKVYAVVMANSEATLKTVYRRDDNFELVPSNSRYSSKIVKAEDVIKLVRAVKIERKL